MTLTVKLNETQCEAIKSLSDNATADTVLYFFSRRNRYSRVTDLDSLKREMEKEGLTFNLQDFKTFFEKMEQANFGIVKHSRDPNLMGSFIWDYSLRTVAKVIYPEESDSKNVKIHKVRQMTFVHANVAENGPAPTTAKVETIEAPKKKRGRPFGSKNKVKEAKKSGRGRPKGSKNKPKGAVITLPVTQTQANALQQALLNVLKSA